MKKSVFRYVATAAVAAFLAAHLPPLDRVVGDEKRGTAAWNTDMGQAGAASLFNRDVALAMVLALPPFGLTALTLDPELAKQAMKGASAETTDALDRANAIGLFF